MQVFIVIKLKLDLSSQQWWPKHKPFVMLLHTALFPYWARWCAQKINKNADKSVPQLGWAPQCGPLSQPLQSELVEQHLLLPVFPASCWTHTLEGTSVHPAWPGRWTCTGGAKRKAVRCGFDWIFSLTLRGQEAPNQHERTSGDKS